LRLSKVKRRFAKRIAVSRIAEQFWCEKKLEIKLMHGIEIKNDAMAVGEKVHREVALRDSLPEADNFLDWLGLQVYFSNVSLSQFYKNGIAREVFLVANISQENWKWFLTGSVDELKLRDGKVQIVERKTRRSGGIPANLHHRIQAMLYHRMLGMLKRQDYSENLKAAYGLKEGVRISREFAEKAGIGNREIMSISREISTKIMELPSLSDTIWLIYERQRGGETIGEVKFRVDEAWLEKIIDFARAYWTGEREALKTKDDWKCKYCELRRYCE